MKKVQILKLVSGVVLVSAFMFAGKVLFDIFDYSTYDSQNVQKDLLWSFSSGVFIVLIIPLIRKRLNRPGSFSRG